VSDDMAANDVVAVDLGGTKIAAALVKSNGGISRRVVAHVDTASPTAPVNQIVGLTRDLVGKKKLNGHIKAVGIAVPGLVRRDGTVWAPNLPGWRKMPLARRVEHALRVPVIVENDRNAAVLGETWRGAAKGKSDAIVLMLGTGIGAGILSGGRLIRGAHELSGCAGWMIVADSFGHEARSVGQLESLAAGPAIARLAAKEMSAPTDVSVEEAASKPLTAEQLAEAARRGDPIAIKVYSEAGRVLGCAVANLVSLFDPEIVVIGGGLAQASDLFLDDLRKSMKERAQPIAGKRVGVITSRLGGDANLLGVAQLALMRA
jgi:glucokinase